MSAVFPSSLLLVLFGILLLTFSHCLHGNSIPTPPPARFLTKKFKTISGKHMAYVEVGEGDPIIFLHGNPTSSYLWRNVMPYLEAPGRRLIAPDLIGMGDSEKLNFSRPNLYTFVQHSNFLFQLLEALNVKNNVTLVLHDWGSALGFLWAFYNRANPSAVKGIAFFEAIVTPFSSATFAPDAVDFFTLMRSPAGENLILQQNLFIERVLPDSILRSLEPQEFAEYRRPFLQPGEDRRPTLTWPRQLPIDGVPTDVTALVEMYSQWLATSNIPKLFIKGEPGILITNGSEPLKLVRSWPLTTETSVKGIHFLQEDSPDDIGRAIANWLPS